AVKSAKDLNSYVIENQSKMQSNYVFIDEIQEIEYFEHALHSLLLAPSIDLYCTDSNAELLSGDIAGRLSGHFIEIQVYSLTYTEFLTYQQALNSRSIKTSNIKIKKTNFNFVPFLIGNT